jgi:thiamine-monophosphate kinase
MRTIKDLGEFGLIARLEKLLHAEGCTLVGQGLGIGDDAAVLPALPGQDWLFSADTQIEGRHFNSAWFSPEQVGSRAMAVNLSDIGAMGGRPHAVLISLGLRADMPIETIEGWYRGFARQLSPWQATVIGGNICLVDGPPFIDITAIGRIKHEGAVRRAGALPEQAVIVSGFPGQATAGLRLLQEQGLLAKELYPQLVRSYLEPGHRVGLGLSLAAQGLVSAMTDSSDGLAADLANLCRASGCGAQLEAAALPLSREMVEVAARWEENPVDLVLGASDDYELLCTCPRENVAEILSISTPDQPLTCIGWTSADPNKLHLELKDSVVGIDPRGWDHLA